MKIALRGEMETLLIPLYGKAEMSRKGFFRDVQAEAAVEQIDYDFSRLRIQEKTQILLSIRGAQIDGFTNTFLQEHPRSTVIYLGCGLDARASRLGYPAKRWYDLDFPQVIEIKKQLYEERENYRYLPFSVTVPGWTEEVEHAAEPVLVIAEGLFMYLREAEVKALLITLRDSFGEVTLIFDVYSRLTAKHAARHPSLSRTGAAIRWGIDSPGEVEAFGEGIRHLKTLYFTEGSELRRLPFHYRMMFRLANGFRAAREAHRIFVVRLSA